MKHTTLKNITVIALTATALTTLGACQSTADRLARVGLEPEMNTVNVPEEKTTVPMYWPIKTQPSENISSVNSLWSSRTKGFFTGEKKLAHEVGDIITVKVSINDKAELENETERTRENTESSAAPEVFGLQGKITDVLPFGGQANPANLFSVTSNTDSKGEGIIEREEQIETQLAAVVTQLLPNGNMVIYGTQEVRVNFEVRQLTIEGVIRPGDIDLDNSVDINRIAEARVSYGGKGLISDFQQPRLGNQIIDILSPF